MRKLKRAKRPNPRMTRRECEADAELAAEMAGNAAVLAVEWAIRSGVGEDDASEAVLAAARARLAAERVRHTRNEEAARLETAAAWAATESALEADQRVVEGIASAISGG